MFTKYLIFIRISKKFKSILINFNSYNNFLNTPKDKNSFFNQILKDEQGLATIETVPLLSIFIILITYALGFWGSIHSGVLSAMAARNYAFETFRNRSHLTQFRDNIELSDGNPNFLEEKWEMRVHRVVEDGISSGDSPAIQMPISFNDYNLDKSDRKDNDQSFHNDLTTNGAGRLPSSLGYNENQSERGSNTIWLQVGYGYCLTLECGGD